MKWMLIISFLFVTPVVFAQPTGETIKKHKIKKWVEKRSDEISGAEKIIWYDRQGNDSVIKDGEILIVYKNEYQDGRIIKKAEVPPEGSEGDMYDYEFKPDGSYKATYTDGDFKMKSYEWYDAKGKLIRSQSPDGNTTSYKYDAKGKLLAVTSDGKNGGVKINHKYSYNSAGQLVKLEKTVENNKSITTYQYDSKGRIAKKLEKATWEGEKTETESVNEYNAKNLLIKVKMKSKTGSDPATVSTITYEYEYY